MIAEVFNVFDFANFSGYDLNYGTYQIVNDQVVVERNPNLGTPTAVITDLRQFGAPRRFQLGMRYTF